MEARLNTILSSYQGNQSELIPILQQVQKDYGYLPEQEMLDIAKFTRVPESRVYAVASFYAQFRFTPIGRNRVSVCRGTACHVRGAQRVLEEVERRIHVKEGETSEDLEYTLETVACIGCCALAPCMVVNDKVESKVTTKKVKSLFQKGQE
jgi:NADH-quinone oxidoreductase subunit E